MSEVLFDSGDFGVCTTCGGSKRIQNPDGSLRPCPGCEPQSAKAGRDSGMQRAYDHAKKDFIRAAYTEGISLARARRDFTSEDILVALEARGIETHENRALGAVMRKLSKNGYIVKTSEMREGVRSTSHRRPMSVWRSRIQGS